MNETRTAPDGTARLSGISSFSEVDPELSHESVPVCHTVSGQFAFTLFIFIFQFLHWWNHIMMHVHTMPSFQEGVRG